MTLLEQYIAEYVDDYENGHEVPETLTLLKQQFGVVTVLDAIDAEVSHRECIRSAHH